jgi:membrane-associated phospholipid phosphatase
VIGQGESIDVQLFYWIFEGWRADWLTPVMVFFSDALKTLPGRIGAVLLWGYLLWRGGKARAFALWLIPVLILTNETCDFLKAWVGRERPCVALPIEAITGKLTSGSFPSAHAANMSALVGTATALWGRRALAMAILVAADGGAIARLCGRALPIRCGGGLAVGLAVRLGRRAPRAVGVAARTREH